MFRDFTDIELICLPERVEVWYASRHVVSFGVHDDGQFILAMSNDAADRIDFREHLPVELKKLDTFILTREVKEGAMGIPKLVKTTATDRLIEAPRRPKPTEMGVSAEHIGEHQKQKVIDALLDSMLDFPDQTLEDQRAETKRIAARFGEKVPVVAAVRAHVTMGSYLPQGVSFDNDDETIRYQMERRRAQRAKVAVANTTAAKAELRASATRRR